VARLRVPHFTWRLRTALLAPILLLVPLVLALTGTLWEGTARREAETLVAQRQATALAGVSAQLQERRQANKTIVYLLSKREGLSTAMLAADTLRLAQTLVLMQATLDLAYINVYASSGKLLLHIGRTGTEGVDGFLVAAAILGKDESAVASSDNGLVVSAAATVAGVTGTAGVLVVGTEVPASVLRDVQSAEDVAVFDHGRVVDTSLYTSHARPDLLSQLSTDTASIETVADIDGLNARLAHLHIRAAGIALSSTSVLVAMVSTDDLDRASRQRTILLVGGGLALVLALVLIALIQARAIARPLEKLVVVAGALVRGEYRRVEPSRNHELHALGQAVNHLADRLDHKMAELTHQASHDSLSGLPNRKLFLKCVNEALVAGAGTGVAVLFLDLDNFKMVNDSLGHSAGDQLIVDVAGRLRACFGDESGLRGTVARLGGDEFTILLADAAVDEITTRRIAERLVETLSAPFQIGRHALVVSASIGIAHSTPELNTAEDLLRAADVAMYRSKGTGRGRCVVYETAMGQHAAERLDQETELRQAIETGALRVFYQPIVDLASGQVREVEALVRWHHPSRGLISPSEFIGLAEETGLIVPLGRWVLEEACRQLQVWQRDYPVHPPLVLNVNLSARQLAQPDLVGSVRGILEDTGIPPASLTLEITESCLMEDSDANQLRGLAALGIHLAIDDFGTGYSSLAYLSRMPIQTLKIDRSFVSRLGQEPESHAVVQTIIALARALGLGVTAEGIERPEQSALLRALGCTRGQGFLFARPLPAEDVDFGVTVVQRQRAA
jgi:diguanylate cyclase (GGDEF)-like protein